MFDLIKNRSLKEITPAYIYAACVSHCKPIANRLTDEKLLKILYRGYVGKKLNLEQPQYYTEKLNWLKLHDHNPLYNIFVDKYEVKQYVADKIGAEYIIPTLGVWESFDSIDFRNFPNQFVLKCTHDSHSVVIVKDSTNFDYLIAKKKIEKHLKNNFYLVNREWPYKDVKPRIIAESFMCDENTGELKNYKFFCFNGEVKVLYVTSGQEINSLFIDFFDLEFKHLDIFNGCPNAPSIPKKPKNFEKMKFIASVLAKGIPHVRVDLYEINGKVYFGELTLYHQGGIVPMKPEKWEKIFGDWLLLP